MCLRVGGFAGQLHALLGQDSAVSFQNVWTERPGFQGSLDNWCFLDLNSLMNHAAKTMTSFYWN